MNPIQLDAFDLAISAILVLLDAGLSIAYGLRLHRQLLIAAVRMVVQLLLVGVVLRTVFASGSVAATLAVILFMIAAAAREVAVRPKLRLGRAGSYRIASIIVATASIATVLLALLTAVRPTPWYDPRYAIPLMGIVLGNVLNGGSLALDTFFSEVSAARRQIEARLALGENMRAALKPFVRSAIRRGIIPIVNQMSAAGIITLPGIMTGQMLAGMDPLEAVKYQILLMFLLAGGSGLAATGAVFLAGRALSDERQRLRLERLHAGASG